MPFLNFFIKLDSTFRTVLSPFAILIVINALLYPTLERKISEQIEYLNQQLLYLSELVFVVIIYY